jgi:hypothetical protein
MTYQCNDCAGTERLHAAEEKTLRILYAKKYPNENAPKIQSGQRRQKMRRILHSEFSPNFKPTREGQELGRQRFIQNAAAGKKYPKKTRANTKRHWSGDELPKGINFGICIVCKKLIETMNSSNPRFHRACHQEWERTPEGRAFQSRRVRGQKVDLAIPKRRGPTVDNDALATAYRWTVQYSHEGKSYRRIAEESGMPFSTVRDQIHRLVSILDPDLLASRFQPAARSLLAEFNSRSRESET